jgi:hypothetical protein
VNAFNHDFRYHSAFSQPGKYGTSAASAMGMTEFRQNIRWTRIDVPGHETAELVRTADGWQLAGEASFDHEGSTARLSYDIRTDAAWLTESAVVTGTVGDRDIDIELLRNYAGEWAVNGSKVWEVTGCDDIDLNFSPSTNMLPIRRLKLVVGEGATVHAAWLRFPSFALEPFEQTYTRTAEDRYVYESAGGKFRRELTVDANGFVLEYPGLWKVESP